MLEMLLGLGFKDVFPPESPSHPLAARFGVWKWGKKNTYFICGWNGHWIGQIMMDHWCPSFRTKICCRDWQGNWVSLSETFRHRQGCDTGQMGSSWPAIHQQHAACCFRLALAIRISRGISKTRKRERQNSEMDWNGVYLCVSMPIYAYLGLKVQLVTSGLMD